MVTFKVVLKSFCNLIDMVVSLSISFHGANAILNETNRARYVSGLYMGSFSGSVHMARRCLQSGLCLWHLLKLSMRYSFVQLLQWADYPFCILVSWLINLSDQEIQQDNNPAKVLLTMCNVMHICSEICQLLCRRA
jgi:hypothetical protein